MPKGIIDNKESFTKKEKNINLENELRSRLRYSWQKTVTYILSYNPQISEATEELQSSFLTFISKNYPKKQRMRNILAIVFKETLNQLHKGFQIDDLDLENIFIEKAVEKLKPIIF
jgi:hypothetical protein